jgi:CheY-like chemotaxis protein
MSDGASSKKYILLVEDNDADVFLVREALAEQDLGSGLHVINDGAEALAFIDEIDKDPERLCPARLLLDLHLLKHDGDAILEHVRASERCAEMPVVVLSSSDSPQDRATAKKYAALHYFRKPSSLDEFMELGKVVRNVLEGSIDLQKKETWGYIKES